jgi:hypothetical protein
MRAIIKIVVVTLLAVASAQCGGGSKKDSRTPSEGCSPASVRRCVGPLSCKGDQVCSADGTWAACVCDPTVPGGGYDASVSDDASASPDLGLPDALPAVQHVLLDDMEGTAFPNGPIPFSVTGSGVVPGFWGSWVSAGDPSNLMSPAPFAYASLPAPHQTLDGVTSSHAAHLVCRVADLYGYCEQGVWLAQNPATSPDAGPSDMNHRMAVDLSAYEALVFWAMASKPTRLKIVVENADTDVLGGRCGQTDASADQCGDAFSRQVQLTDGWRRYEVKFSDLSQVGWGHAAPSGKLDPRTVYLIGFQIDGPQSKTDAPVEADFWIDDIYLRTNPPPDGVCIRGSDELIADFLDDSRLNPADGRKGSFSVTGDSLGAFTPPKVKDSAYPIDLENGNNRCSGAGSFHTKAVGFADWGASISADFVARSGPSKGTYDASKYRGVSFWARASAPLQGVKVSFPDVYTDGGADPRTIDPSQTPCVFESGSKFNCSPYLVKLGDSDFPAYKKVQIDTTWKRFDILFADTQQDFFNPGFHTAENKLDSKHLTSMAIQIGALYVNDKPAPNDFEIWIDDVYFIK